MRARDRFVRSLVVVTAFAGSAALAAACASSPQPADGDRGAESAMFGGDKHVRNGRNVWFTKTFGGGYFLNAVLPAAKGLKLGFDVLFATPRKDRFAQFGVINDPDCHEPRPGDTVDPMHPHDVCPDPEASGIVGIRVEHDYNLATGAKDPSAPRYYGVACAACHAGFDPVLVPLDPAEPQWWNIHPTIGNLRMQYGKIFGAHVDPSVAPPGSATWVKLVATKAIFDSWNPGAVDTTTLFDDGVNNPGVVTAFFDVPDRPYFTNSQGTFHRSGQGGEDDVGGQTAAARVYSNIGMCFRECSAKAVLTSTPVDTAACKASCTQWPSDDDLNDIVSFLNTVKHPRNPFALPDEVPIVEQGKAVFESTCASCHSGKVHSSDLVLKLGAETSDPATTGVDANDCRALTTNWDTGKIWADFSSTELKARGFKGYRVLPLNGMWATAPYLHHNGVGQIDLQHLNWWQENQDFEASAWQLLTPPALRTGTRYKLSPLPNTNPAIPFPTVPTNLLNAASGGRACDVDELKGHSWGTDLPEAKKKALIEYLRTL